MMRLHTESMRSFFVYPSSERRMVMAAGSLFFRIICLAGTAAAVAALLILITGIAVIFYGIRHFDEWEEKW